MECAEYLREHNVEQAQQHQSAGSSYISGELALRGLPPEAHSIRFPSLLKPLHQALDLALSAERAAIGSSAIAA